MALAISFLVGRIGLFCIFSTVFNNSFSRSLLGVVQNLVVTVIKAEWILLWQILIALLHLIMCQQVLCEHSLATLGHRIRELIRQTLHRAEHRTVWVLLCLSRSLSA